MIEYSDTRSREGDTAELRKVRPELFFARREMEHALLSRREYGECHSRFYALSQILSHPKYRPQGVDGPELALTTGDIQEAVARAIEGLDSEIAEGLRDLTYWQNRLAIAEKEAARGGAKEGTPGPNP